MKIRKAERKQAKIRLGLQGPSGSGKTYGALLIAHGLVGNWSKIAVIDTEFRSADLYAHIGDYNVLNLEKPFSPERYIQAIEFCEKAEMEVIIIDSITHEWESILEIHGNMVGNSFTNWSKLTPRHNAFVNSILQSKCHVISTVRAKQDYVLTEKNGKHVPEKVGLKGITRDGMDYEFTVVLDIDIKHNCSASKDRTGLFMDKPAFIIKESIGKTILDWCNSGIKADDVLSKIKECSTEEDLRKLYNQYPDFQSLLKAEFTKRKEALNNLNLQTQNLTSNGINSNNQQQQHIGENGSVNRD